jgi:hypothetical protein
MAITAALSGSLQDLPLRELLDLLAAGGRTGAIELDGAAPGLVVLVEGRISLALTDDGPTLQQVVLGSGLTTADGWDRAEQDALAGASLADALVSEGADPVELEAALREQAISALFEFVLPSETHFTFVPDARHPLGDRFTFPAPDLIEEASRRIDAWRVIADAIPSTAMVMRLAPEAPNAIVNVPADDWRVLALVDGHRSIAGIIEALGMSAFAVCGVVHRLMVSGLVEST